MDPQVSRIYQSYPKDIQACLARLRSLVFELAREQSIDDLVETVKWGEPAYVCKRGSTLRMAWKAAEPDQYGIYFHCQTTLVDTFRELFGDRFRYEGNRAILFHKDDTLPVSELKQCILMSLRYHDIKNLPLLGA